MAFTRLLKYRETGTFVSLQAMLRYILISILSLYLINRIFNYVFRVLGKPQTPPSFKKPPEGSIRVDSDPKKQSRRNGLQGGEYVDYEEIK